VARRGGLGKGLGALIPTGPGAEAPGGLREIDTASIRPNPYQPRERFDEELLNELTESIREVGILQPVLVRPVGDEFELIAGERRWRAARRLGIGRMPALVRESDDVAALEQALVENIHRADLNALEEAAAYQQLIEDFSLTHDAVASRVGRSRAAVTNTLRLLQLPPSVQKQVRDGALSMGHARALLGTPDRALQERLAAQAVKEGWSVRAIEQAVRAPASPASSSGSKVDPASATKPLRPPGLAELEGLLGDHLDTRVAISMGAKRGKITVEFSDLEDLERIYKTIAG
jgi:ParB family chromosome partitioning protein